MTDLLVVILWIFNAACLIGTLYFTHKAAYYRGRASAFNEATDSLRKSIRLPP